MYVCRTRAYLIARHVEYSSLPPSSETARNKERILARTLIRFVRTKAPSSLLLAYNGTLSETKPLYMEAALGKKQLLIGMKPDMYLVLATEHGVRGYIVEIAATRPTRETMQRLAPRLLLYKLYAEQCIGPRTLALYVPTVPGEPPTLLLVRDPAAAAMLLHRRLEILTGLMEADMPPAPGRTRPPCSECGYRSICPYASTEE